MADVTGRSNLQTTTAPTCPESRAAARPIEAGSYVDCAKCTERVKFQAKIRLLQVICNVYHEGRWLRVEHYHEACYLEADQPYGEAG